jgi:hypothetical protein
MRKIKNLSKKFIIFLISFSIILNCGSCIQSKSGTPHSMLSLNFTAYTINYSVFRNDSTIIHFELSNSGINKKANYGKINIYGNLSKFLTFSNDDPQRKRNNIPGVSECYMEIGGRDSWHIYSSNLDANDKIKFDYNVHSKFPETINDQLIKDKCVYIYENFSWDWSGISPRFLKNVSDILINNFDVNISIITDPPDAQVFINGFSDGGRTPMNLTIPSGKYYIGIKKNWHENLSLFKEITNSKGEVINVSLKRLICILMLNISPTGATTSIDGDLIGNTTNIEQDKIYHLSISKAGYKTYRTKIVAHNGTMFLSRNLEPAPNYQNSFYYLIDLFFSEKLWVFFAGLTGIILVILAYKNGNKR